MNINRVIVMNSEHTCNVKIVHKDAVERAVSALPDAYTVAGLELFFKVFADSTRIKILSALLSTELCVCDLCSVLEMKQSAVSQQLRFLRQMRLVKSRQDGKSVYYSLDDSHIKEILRMGIEHIGERS